jgi:hypothetical protein
MFVSGSNELVDSLDLDTGDVERVVVRSTKCPGTYLIDPVIHPGFLFRCPEAQLLGPA